MMKQIVLYIIVFMVACTSFSETKTTTNMNTEYDFSNQDVTWDGSFLGLFPILTQKAIEFKNNYPKNGDNQMLDYLKDESKFVFAHVILSLKHDKNIISGGKWNGLSVHLKADGSINYNMEEIDEIEKIWTEMLNR